MLDKTVQLQVTHVFLLKFINILQKLVAVVDEDNTKQINTMYAEYKDKLTYISYLMDVILIPI